MNAVVLPMWLEIIVAVLVLAGAAVSLLGSIGLLRLPSFFERVHAPAVIATLGCWCILLGTVLCFSVLDSAFAVRAWLVAVFVALTVPITTIFLMRAALFRARGTGQKVPPPLSRHKVPAALATLAAAASGAAGDGSSASASDSTSPSPSKAPP